MGRAETDLAIPSTPTATQPLTPMMRQYVAAKAHNPDAILMFRLGDFYEMFFDDAVVAARELGITLTARDKGANGVPMCGVPHHHVTSYVARLNAAGHRVALCDQLEDAAAAKRGGKGIIQREVTRVATPGVPLTPDAIDARESHYLMAVARTGDAFSFALVESTTGERVTRENCDARDVCDAIGIYAPREVLIDRRDAGADWVKAIAHPVVRPTVTIVDDLAGSSPAASDAGSRAARMALNYIQAAQRSIGHIATTSTAAPETPVLDETTIANLEIVVGADGKRATSLLASLDETVTSMGARLFRARLLAPLTDRALIDARLDEIASWLARPVERETLRKRLAAVADIERLVTKALVGNSTPRDLRALGLTLALLREIRALAGCTFDCAPSLATRILTTLVDDPPLAHREGGLVRRGFHADIDDLADAEQNARGLIASIEERERVRTGIPTLKVRYNRVFGFVIEVTKSHLTRIPADYQRRQTIAGGERFVTPELKAEEDKVLHAAERRAALEADLFEALRAAVAEASSGLRATAQAVAALDVALALAEVAASRTFARPTITTDLRTDIVDGRHPVLERFVATLGERFVPNSLTIDANGAHRQLDTPGDPHGGLGRDAMGVAPVAAQILVLTGPNMAGKSTVMRQTAIIQLLAQTGAYVPAREATVGIVDRIFTRVGARDDLARGQSTFMVEMTETSRILERATRQSLIVLDELGRGTSTFDGISIAWAVAEHIHDRIGARTLFATHYHELADLPRVLPRARNFQLAVKEWNDEIVFLRRLVPGAAGRSYGIQVARLAALPLAVIDRAREILALLESSNADAAGRPAWARAIDLTADDVAADAAQLPLFARPAPPVERTSPSPRDANLRALDLSTLTPIEALNLLYKWKADLENK